MIIFRGYGGVGLQPEYPKRQFIMEYGHGAWARTKRCISIVTKESQTGQTKRYIMCFHGNKGGGQTGTRMNLLPLLVGYDM